MTFPQIPQRTDDSDDSHSGWRQFLTAAVVLGGLAIVLRTGISDLTALGSALILSGAALFIGILVGFIFGIPKTVQHKADAATGGPSPEGGYQPNTNLEEISDWLTKMLVGIGLVELNRVPGLIDAASAYFEPCLGPPCSRAYVAGLLLYFTTTGFLAGYLWTRLALVGDFIEKDPRRLIGKVLQKVARATGNNPTVIERSPDRQVVTPDEVQAANALASLAAGSNVGIEDLRQQVRKLATQYEALRATMASSHERTRKMEVIASQMRTLSLAAYPLLPELARSESAGDRLAAVTFLQARPSPSYYDWLADRLREEKPFIGYHAAVALQTAARASSPETRDQLRAAIDKALSNVGHLPESTDRVAVLRSAREALG